MRFIYRPAYDDADHCMDVARHRENINRQLGWETGDQKYAIMNHFIGACGELAVSRIFGIEWDGAKLDMLDYQEWRKTKVDLGFFEVKTISSINPIRGCLILGDKDKDWATAILAWAPDAWNVGATLLNGGKRRLNLQSIHLFGHIPVKDGKKIGDQQVIKTKYTTKTRYIISRDKLRPIEELEKVASTFDRLRKIKPELTIHDTTFRLTKWVI